MDTPYVDTPDSRRSKPLPATAPIAPSAIPRRGAATAPRNSSAHSCLLSSGRSPRCSTMGVSRCPQTPRNGVRRMRNRRTDESVPKHGERTSCHAPVDCMQARVTAVCRRESLRCKRPHGPRFTAGMRTPYQTLEREGAKKLNGEWNMRLRSARAMRERSTPVTFCARKARRNAR